LPGLPSLLGGDEKNGAANCGTLDVLIDVAGAFEEGVLVRGNNGLEFETGSEPVFCKRGVKGVGAIEYL
jgi:hypothetical protein